MRRDTTVGIAAQNALVLHQESASYAATLRTSSEAVIPRNAVEPPFRAVDRVPGSIGFVGAQHSSRAEEPEVAQWRAVDDGALLELLRQWPPADRPGLILVDGRSGSGKSTFAAHAADLLEACVVSTDDIAWNHAMFDWTDVLLAGVLQPWPRGEGVRFRPPAWESHDREGSIAVKSGVALLVEGVGAARAGLAGLADLAVWVQSDLSQARTRGLARDVAYGSRTLAQAEAFWDEWMLEEEPFLAADRPWERAHLWVLGTPPDMQTWIRDGSATQ